MSKINLNEICLAIQKSALQIEGQIPFSDKAIDFVRQTFMGGGAKLVSEVFAPQELARRLLNTDEDVAMKYEAGVGFKLDNAVFPDVALAVDKVATIAIDFGTSSTAVASQYRPISTLVFRAGDDIYMLLCFVLSSGRVCVAGKVAEQEDD